MIQLHFPDNATKEMCISIWRSGRFQGHISYFQDGKC